MHGYTVIKHAVHVNKRDNKYIQYTPWPGLRLFCFRMVSNRLILFMALKIRSLALESLYDFPIASDTTQHSWWHHQMETLLRCWPFVRGIHRSPMDSPHEGQWRGALMFSFICAWTNDWTNNRDSGNLRPHCAHYNVTVMSITISQIQMNCWNNHAKTKHNKPA